MKLTPERAEELAKHHAAASDHGVAEIRQFNAEMEACARLAGLALKAHRLGKECDATPGDSEERRRAFARWLESSNALRAACLEASREG